MTPLQWFNSYVDAVDFAACLLKCKTPQEAGDYASRTIGAYESVKGDDYADFVRRQACFLVEGVRVLREDA